MKRMFLTPLVLCVALLAACGTINPFAAAKGTDEKAYAVLGMYEVYQKQILEIVKDDTLPSSVRRAAAESDALAVPVLGELNKALIAYLDAREALEAGTGSREKVAIATANLKDWTERGRELVEGLKKAIAGSKKPLRASTMAPLNPAWSV